MTGICSLSWSKNNVLGNHALLLYLGRKKATVRGTEKIRGEVFCVLVSLGVCVAMMQNDLTQAHGTVLLGKFFSPYALLKPHATLRSYIQEHFAQYLVDPRGIRKVVKNHRVFEGLPWAPHCIHTETPFPGCPQAVREHWSPREPLPPFIACL